MSATRLFDRAAEILAVARSTRPDVPRTFAEGWSSGYYWQVHPRDLDECFLAVRGHTGPPRDHILLLGLPVREDERAVEGPILCDELGPVRPRMER